MYDMNWIQGYTGKRLTTGFPKQKKKHTQDTLLSLICIKIFSITLSLDSQQNNKLNPDSQHLPVSKV